MGREERSSWERRQRLERIIDAAERIFVTQGVYQTSMETIAKETGYTRQTLYLYFKNKEDLIAAVVLRKMTLVHNAMAEAARVQASGLERVRALGTAYYRFFQENNAYLELFVTFFMKSYAYHKPITAEANGIFMAECQKINDAIIDLILPAIECGIADGSIKTTRTPQHLMILLWAQLIGVLQAVSVHNALLDETSQLSAEEFFAYFMEFVEIALTHTLKR